MLRLQLTILSILVLVLTSCENQTIIDVRHANFNSEENVKEEVEIWHTYSDEETRIFENEVIPLFEQKYPQIDVNPVRQPHNKQLMSALISRASVNRTPDIIRMDITWLPKFVELELLYPVSNFKDFDQVKDRFYRAPLESNRYGENYYGLPLNTNTKAAIYNKQLVEDIGLETLPETMDELIQIVVEHDLKIGINDVSPWNSLPYFYGLGGKLTDPDYTQATGYLNSKESIEAVKRLLQLFNNGNLPPQVLSGYPEGWQNIRNGEYFMIDEGPWFYSVHSKDEIALLNEQTVSGTFPSNEEHTSILGGENVVITKGTQHPEASWTFIKWMTTESPQRLLLKAGVLPTNRRVEMSSIIDEYPYYESYIDSIDKTFLRPPVPEWEEINSVFTEYFRQIFSGKISVEKGLQQAAEEIDRLLASENG